MSVELTRRDLLQAAVVAAALAVLPGEARAEPALADPLAFDELPLAGEAGTCSSFAEGACTYDTRRES